MQNVVHACTEASKQAQTQANRNNFSILSKIKRYFSPVWDISTCKRSFHCIMRAECSARVLQRRNKLRHTQIAIIRRFCRKLCVISLPLEIFRRWNAIFSPFYMLKVVHACTDASKQAQTHANRNNLSTLSKIMRYSSPVWDISMLKRSFHSILHAQRSACLLCSVETSSDTRKSQSFDDFVENYALFLSRLRYFDGETLFSLHFTCRTQCAGIPASKLAEKLAILNHSSILKNFMCYFSPFWYISTFKRSFHCNFHIVRSARVFQLRIKPKNSQIVMNHWFWLQ